LSFLYINIYKEGFRRPDEMSYTSDSRLLK
jgi:hypothetical protein